MKTKGNLKNGIIAVGSVALLLVLDQITKLLAIRNLMGKDPFVIWKGVFELTYLENRGAAFGMLQNRKIFFVIMTVAVLGLIVYFYSRTPLAKRYLPMRICIIFLAAGALGNFIDRLFRGYVVDFFYFSLIDFPVFNVADIYITVTFVVLTVLILFYYKEEELAVYSNRRQKGEADENGRISD